MSSTLHAKPEDLDTIEKRSKYTAAIVGCEQTSVFSACLFADAGFNVICADPDQTTINLLAKGKIAFAQHETEARLKNHVKNGRITTTTDIKTAVSQSNIIIINTSASIDQKKKPDYSDIEKACKLVGANLREGSIVIMTSVVGSGVIEGIIWKTLENSSGFKIGTEIGLAYSPTRKWHGQAPGKEPNHEQIVAASDRVSLNAASKILETISKGVLKRTTSVETAETAILFEAAQREVNSALDHELAIFCEKVGIDYLETQKLLKPDTPTTYSSSPESDRSTEDASYVLLDDAENLNAKLRAVAVAREINEEMAKHVANVATAALRNCGKTPRRTRISLLGISETPNTKSAPKRLAEKLARIMEARGAKVTIYDPYFSQEAAENRHYFKKTLAEALERADCIVLLTPHDQFKRLSLNRLKVTMKMPAAIVDLERIFQPDKAEKEGFVYRGLGRGALVK
jgi:UDP-N-acetyl-D-galactosamine dehydrogenase